MKKSDRKQSRRLTREDWVEAAIELFAGAGIGAISIDRLAASLGVTRGSFYHHFADREALLRALLEHWAHKWTYAVRDEVIGLGLDPATTLLALMKLIRSRRAAYYDVPIRAWALQDPRAREVVAKVDRVRLAFIQAQFEALGFRGLDAENRARLYLHHEMAAPSMFSRPSATQEERLLLARHRLLTTAFSESPSVVAQPGGDHEHPNNKTAGGSDR